MVRVLIGSISCWFVGMGHGSFVYDSWFAVVCDSDLSRVVSMFRHAQGYFSSLGSGHLEAGYGGELFVSARVKGR